MHREALMMKLIANVTYLESRLGIYLKVQTVLALPKHLKKNLKRLIR